MTTATARRLRARRPAIIDPRRGPAIKRNVHEFLVDAPAAALAGAFEDTLVDPRAEFAGLVIQRQPGRAGRRFELGERFQAAFRLPVVGLFTADYAEIDLLERDREDGVFRARYRYLEGAPLAGSSTITIEPAPGGARLTVVFELQERGLFAVEMLHRFGIRAHDRAVRAQVDQVAATLGATVTAATC